MTSSDDHYISLLSHKYDNKKTLKEYLTRLNTIKTCTSAPTIHDILIQPALYYPYLKLAYPSISTRKNLLTVLLVLFRESADLPASAYTKWYKLHDDLARLQEAHIKRSEPEQKHIDNYTSYTEIINKYHELKALKYYDTERHNLQLLLLAIIIYLRPKRADLGSVRIYNDDPHLTDHNYIVLGADPSAAYLVMNIYKTAKYYNRFEELIPIELYSDITESLSRYPRDYLFRKDDKLPMSNNTYSAFVKTTFEQLFGRSTSLSLIRHIYITEKLDFNKMSIEELEKEAKLMLHTSGLQRKYKWTDIK